mmetsp:Transcript_30083/g.48605  ORF Transcript_30083/g.48605 Transcript_30083/m.48605 type:complete len:113 (+) Transcript_30083:481-819(+)
MVHVYWGQQPICNPCRVQQIIGHLPSPKLYKKAPRPHSHPWPHTHPIHNAHPISNTWTNSYQNSNSDSHSNPNTDKGKNTDPCTNPPTVAHEYQATNTTNTRDPTLAGTDTY